MKRIGYLITEETITVDFCKEVIYEASKRKRKRDNVMRVLNNIEHYAKRLRKMILSDGYVPSKYSHEVRIEHGKERKLQKARFFPDQCIHHVLIMLIRDKITKRIDHCAVASIPKRGQSAGLRKLKYWIQRESNAKRISKYCGKGDIRKCFESVKPNVVMDMYERFIKDKKYLRLMEKVVYSYDSLPLGNYCSAWTINLLLKNLDEAIRKNPCVNHYLRYMDDFVFMCSNKRKAKKVKKIVEKELEKLGLELKDNFQLFNIDNRGIDMMGYRIFRNYTILRKRNFKKIFRKVKQMQKLKFYPVKDCQSLMSLLGQCRHCNSKYVWKIVGRKIDLHVVKKVISESSRAYSLGEGYKPKMILI